MRLVLFSIFIVNSLCSYHSLIGSKMSKHKSDVKKMESAHIDRRKYRRILQEIKYNSVYIEHLMNAEENALIKIDELLDEC